MTGWMTGMDDWQVFIERLDYNDQLLTDGRTLLDVKSLLRLKKENLHIYPLHCTPMVEDYK